MSAAGKMVGAPVKLESKTGASAVLRCKAKAEQGPRWQCRPLVINATHWICLHVLEFSWKLTRISFEVRRSERCRINFLAPVFASVSDTRSS
jgi:hypothetical protein